MTLLELLTLSAASWYLSYVITQLPGPLGLFDKVRNYRAGKWHGRRREPEYVVTTGVNASIKGGDVKYKGLLDCIFCLGFWVSIGLALITGHTILDGIAVCGAMLWAHAYSSWVHIGGNKDA